MKIRSFFVFYIIGLFFPVSLQASVLHCATSMTFLGSPDAVSKFSEVADSVAGVFGDDFQAQVYQRGRNGKDVFIVEVTPEARTLSRTEFQDAQKAIPKLLAKTGSLGLKSEPAEKIRTAGPLSMLRSVAKMYGVAGGFAAVSALVSVAGGQLYNPLHSSFEPINLVTAFMGIGGAMGVAVGGLTAVGYSLKNLVHLGSLLWKPWRSKNRFNQAKISEEIEFEHHRLGEDMPEGQAGVILILGNSPTKDLEIPY